MGFTTRSPSERLSEHNLGNVLSTKLYKPWQVIYFEGYLNEDDARLRERQLKQYGGAWRKLRDRLKNSLDQKRGGIHSVGKPPHER